MVGGDYDHFPGWVKCKLVDAHGDEHVFIEKSPLVCANWDQSPRAAYLDCIVQRTMLSESNHIVLHVSSEKPWGIESTDGLTEFVVTEDQLETALVS
jgi:hypothetical protein